MLTNSFQVTISLQVKEVELKTGKELTVCLKHTRSVNARFTTMIFFLCNLGFRGETSSQIPELIDLPELVCIS